ncbi:hypothetical protein [Lichenicoccus sp.]|uniref:hypothetical protein n=1 Tax=Lichenicoccus sp. TaxID=2781899 RepID=UPI003D0A70B8
MAYILAFSDEPVPTIPQAPSDEEAGRGAAAGGRAADRREHFGTEEAALRRAAELLPAPSWRQLRLYGPDGLRMADQAELERRLAQPALPGDVQGGTDNAERQQ